MKPHRRHSTSSVFSDQARRFIGLKNVIAETSNDFRLFVRSHGVGLKFSPVSSDGVCVADATANPTNAYKVRGALVSAECARRAGRDVLVTASAGNHGAGLAYAARALGMQAVVYVPTTAPRVKVDAIVSFGAQVRSVGSSFDPCLEEARRDPLIEGGSGTFVHPFDEHMVVAGQGTIGFELRSHVQSLRAQGAYDFDKVRIFLPIGGGGLAAGVGAVVKSFWPDDLPPPEIVGVIDESSPASFLSLMRGRRVKAIPDTIADGTKVAEVGDTFLMLAPLVDYLLLVPHDDIVSVMRDYKATQGVELEGAGALALAGESLARRYNLFGDDEPCLSMPIVTGKNIDPELFEREVTMRPRMDKTTLKRKAFDIQMVQSPGELLRFLECVKEYNIASLTHTRRESSLVARVRVEFEVARAAEQDLVECIESNFGGSRVLAPGEHVLYRVERPAMTPSSEKLIQLDDRPGAFLEYVRSLTISDSSRLVDFLFYRKPAQIGSKAQVVIGSQRCDKPYEADSRSVSDERDRATL